MHLIWREVSPYMNSHLCLGVFTDREQAERARSDYIVQMAQGDDRWSEQPFREVDLHHDVRIVSDLPLRDIPAQAHEVFVVSGVEEGLGQIYRDVLAICGSLAAAEAVAQELRDGSETPSFPRYADIETLPVNALQMQPVSVDDRNLVAIREYSRRKR